MMKYPVDPFEQLSDEKLRSTSQYEHPIGDDSISNIQANFSMKLEDVRAKADTAEEREEVSTGKNSRKRRYMLVVAATLVVALILAGFVNYERFLSLFYQHFGESVQIDNHLVEVGRSDSDQGITVEVLSVANDGENTYLFVDVTDETGDRLSEETVMTVWSIDPLPSNPVFGSGSSLIEYNPETRTATFVVYVTSASPGDAVCFTLLSFVTGDTFNEMIAEELDISELLALQESGNFVKGSSFNRYGSTEFLEDGQELGSINDYLELDALDIAVQDFEYARISNIAYRDGLLHVQLNESGRLNTEGDIISGVFPYLIDSDTGEQVAEVYYGIEMGAPDYSNPNLVHGNFSHGEYVFKIDEATLANCTLAFYSNHLAASVVGQWNIEFVVPGQMETLTIETDAEIEMGIKTMSLSSVVISPLSVKIYMQDSFPLRGDVEVALNYRDGSRDVFIDSENDGRINIEIPQGNGPGAITVIRPASNIEDIASIELNGVVILQL